MDYKFLEELFKNVPAKITAETDAKGNMNIRFDGRWIELLALSLAINERVIEKCPLTIDDYCDILKSGSELKKKSKEQKDVENVIINKMLRDIFK